jgi:hypothetical protein
MAAAVGLAFTATAQAVPVFLLIFRLSLKKRAASGVIPYFVTLSRRKHAYLVILTAIVAGLALGLAITQILIERNER